MPTHPLLRRNRIPSYAEAEEQSIADTLTRCSLPVLRQTLDTWPNSVRSRNLVLRAIRIEKSGPNRPAHLAAMRAFRARLNSTSSSLS